MQYKELSTKCYDNNNVPKKINFNLNATIKKIKHFSPIVYVRMWRAFFLPQNHFFCALCVVCILALYIFFFRAEFIRSFVLSCFVCDAVAQS